MLRSSRTRLQHAELVVVGIGQHDPTDIALTDVDSSRSEPDETIHFGSLINAVERGHVEMQPVLCGLRNERRAAPGDEGTSQVGRAYRGLLILIPYQRPSEYFAPEVTGLARAVAVDRAETSAVREEGITGLDDAELVALWVGEHHMSFVGVLTDVDMATAELDQPRDRVALIVDRCRRQIEMNTVLARFRLQDWFEQDLKSGVVRWDKCDLIIGLDSNVPAQRLGPKTCETQRIIRIKTKSIKARRHLVQCTPLEVHHHGANIQYRSVMPSWKTIEATEPEFAERVRRLFDAGRHKTIATLRADGSPRISGIECTFTEGEVSFGSMTGARKGADLTRDPRFALHGPTFHPEDGKENEWPGEAKIAGRAISAGTTTDEQPDGAMFIADITEVVITGLDAEATKLVVESWTPEHGLRRVERD